MSTVCILTPIVIGSWPMISAAVVAAAGSMGFSVLGTEPVVDRASGTTRVETEVPNSQVVAEILRRGEKVRIEKDGVVIEFGVDERGACTVCVSGEGRREAELKRIGEEVAGRVVQQFAYHKLMTELKERNYSIVEESVEEDDSIQVRVRLNR
ncbi:MAG: hypothetical protein ACYS0G_10345 [Planctomycetota bacterium]|jgi:hypothetical protein